MKRYQKHPSSPPAEYVAAATSSFEPTDVVALLDKTGIILQREIQNLLIASAAGKLDPANARSLVDYIKLLSSLKAEQAEALAALTDEELQKLTAKAKS